MSETSEGIEQEIKKTPRVKELFNRFLHRSSKESELPKQIDEVIPDLKPDEIQEPKLDQKIDRQEVINPEAQITDETETPEQPKDLPVQEEERKLKPINRIFFHTTPTRNLPSIIRRGLIGEKGHASIGKELMYSLAFPDEFNEVRVDRLVVLAEGPLSDFVMTIWKANPDIRQNKDKYSNSFYGEYSPAGALGDEEAIPQGYLDSGGGYLYKLKPEQERKNLTRVDSSNYLAAIPLSEENQLFIAECMLKFYQGLSSADILEKDIIEYFQNPKTNLILKPNYPLRDFAHDLIGRIQQEVILNSTAIAANKAEERIDEKAVKIADPSNPYYVDPFFRDLAEVSRKVEAINEPVSQRYLIARKKRLKNLLKEHLPDINLESELEKAIYPNTYGGAKLWGGNEGYKLLQKVKEKTGIDLP